MNKDIEFLANKWFSETKSEVYPFSFACTEYVRRLHKSVPGFSATPLVSLGDYASRKGISAMFVKDESTRFGLKAFKPLGSVWAMFRTICETLDIDYRLTTFQQLGDEPYRSEIRKMTFVTTTDGNHGKGVSWASRLFGCRCYVYMPRGTVEVRAQAIRKAGNAHVEITDMLYDDCVKYTYDLARRNGWYLLQDTTMPTYTEKPLWIMQGYTTMVFEALSQMAEAGYKRPTHVFLQAGVGSMAGAVIASLKSVFPNAMPSVTIVEPTEVACFYESVKANDGKAHKATGNNTTIMAGLNCGFPCSLAWDFVRDYAGYALRCSDEMTCRGMKMLRREAGIVSGESGGVTSGLVDALLSEMKYKEIREEIGLGDESVVLVFNTEGDTDPEGYLRVVGE